MTYKFQIITLKQAEDIANKWRYDGENSLNDREFNEEYTNDRRREI